MIQIEATKNQKIGMAIVGGILVVLLLSYFVWKLAIKNYQQAKAEEAQLTATINNEYQEIVRLLNLRKDYYEKERWLNEINHKISNDAADILSLLTKNSPITNFSLATLEKNKIKVEHDGSAQYPFEIQFKNKFDKIGQYLCYQESSLPISFINNLEITPQKTNSRYLNVKLKGKIYRVN